MKLDAPLNLADILNLETNLELQPDDLDCNSTAENADVSQKQSATVVFGTTFLTIFLAEIGDKTQLSTLLMSAQSKAPWVVFLGSAAALVTTSALGVLLGGWIASRLSPKTVEKAAGVMLLLISVMLFSDLLISH